MASFIIQESCFNPVFPPCVLEMYAAQWLGVFVDNFGTQIEVAGSPDDRWFCCLEEH
jgi:hypothetical protein